MISKEYYKYKRSSLKQVVSHIVFKLVFPSLSLVNQLHLGIKPHEKTSFSQPMLFFWTSLLTILFDDFPPPNLNTNFFFIITFAFSHYPILISLFFFGLFYPFEPNKGGVYTAITLFYTGTGGGGAGRGANVSMLLTSCGF